MLVFNKDIFKSILHIITIHVFKELLLLVENDVYVTKEIYIYILYLMKDCVCM